jgi:hypothetical protein
MEKSRGLRYYKLWMMGLLVNGPTYTFGDNMSVIFNTSTPESTLRNKSNSICYHACREAVAMDEIWTAHEPSITNPTNIATKVLPGGWWHESLAGGLLYDTWAGSKVLHKVPLAHAKINLRPATGVSWKNDWKWDDGVWAGPQVPLATAFSRLLP